MALGAIPAGSIYINGITYVSRFLGIIVMGGNADSEERCERTGKKCKAPLNSRYSLRFACPCRRRRRRRRRKETLSRKGQTYIIIAWRILTGLLSCSFIPPKDHSDTSHPEYTDPKAARVRIINKRKRRGHKIPPAECGRVNKTMSAQNGGRGGCYYQDVWRRGRDTSRSTTPLERPGATPDAGRIVLTRYVGWGHVVREGLS